MTLYLKYRSQKLDELDLEGVREALKKIVTSGSIPHAFLFAGPKGTGKTSAARILAKILNCESLNLSSEKINLSKIEPCNKCYQCQSIAKGENIDVIELDAASHRGIDEIRELRESVKLSPFKARRKVYIIDEAHMLTLDASNALLKTLEEPPDHVIFILATTESQKLIPTIRSRTRLINFTRASKAEIVRALTRVVKGENLKVDENILGLVAESADGSFRDAVKILEQLISENVKLTTEEVKKYLSKVSSFNVDKFIDFLHSRDSTSAISMIEKAIEKGVSVKDLVSKIIEELHSQLFTKIGLEREGREVFSKRELLDLLEIFNSLAKDIPFSFVEQIPLEIAVVEWCEVDRDDEEVLLKKGVDTKNKSFRNIKEKENNYQNNEQEKDASKKDKNLDKKKQFFGVNEISEEIWKKILVNIRPINTSTEALLRAARPLEFNGKILKLGVFYSFHKDRLESIPHRTILEKVISQIIGGKIKVICSLTKPDKKLVKDEVVIKEDQDIKSKEEFLTEGDDEDIIKVAKEIFGS